MKGLPEAAFTASNIAPSISAISRATSGGPSTSAAEVFWMIFSSALLTSMTAFARTELEDTNAASQTIPNSRILQRCNLRQPLQETDWRAIRVPSFVRVFVRRAGCHPVAVLRAAGCIFTIQRASVRLFRRLLERIYSGFIEKFGCKERMSIADF